MMTAILAVENILGADHDIWEVNVDDEYHEAAEETSEQAVTHKDRGGDRLVPQRVEPDYAMRAISDAYARYDAPALGLAIGTVVGGFLFLATALLLLRGGDYVGTHLSLLGNYFVGYDVTWSGALIGLAEGALGGFLFGYILATLINITIELHKRTLIRRIEAMALTDTNQQERW